MFGFSFAAKLIILFEKRVDSLGFDALKLRRDPIFQVSREGFGRNRFYIPCHIQKQLSKVFSRFDIAHVQDPVAPGSVIPGPFHLGIDQSRLCGCKPEIIMGFAPIGDVVIDSRSSRTFLLFGIAKAHNVAVVVVAPYQSNVFGKL